jgi:hypothetical protein
MAEYFILSKILGDFVAWQKFANMELNNKELVLVTYEEDPHYYTITNMKHSLACYNDVLSFATNLGVYKILASEEVELTIDEFLK